MNEKLYLIFYLCGFMGIMFILLCLSCAFWRVFYWVKDKVTSGFKPSNNEPQSHDEAA